MGSEISKQDIIIVVGASAGGVEALSVLSAGLAADLDASVLLCFILATEVKGEAICPRFYPKPARCQRYTPEMVK